jgi:DNA-binding NarL/FixJ family response regulator
MEHSARISVMVVDDHPIMRAGLVGEINSHEDMYVISEACDGREAIQKHEECQPDVTLMDLRLPHVNGLDAIRSIRERTPTAKILVLTTLAGDVQVLRAFRAGAMGYLLKSLLQEELADTVRDIAAGKRKMPPEIAAVFAANTGRDDLTERELSVLRAVAKGCSNKIIAADLNISEHTIKNHVQSILAKLGANDRTHAVTIGLTRGFIEL